MAKLRFKTGGRPLTLDTESVTEEIFQRLPTARQTLKEFRKTTSGFREEEIIGTETSLPEWLDTAIMALTQFDEKNISLSMAREIKSALKTVRKLSSKRLTTRETALEPLITREYREDLQKAIKQAGEKSQTAQIYKNIQKNIEKASKKQRTEFYKSRGYQNISSFRDKRYKKIKAWAQESAGKVMSYREAYAYLLNQRAQDGLSTDIDFSNAPSGDLLFGE